MKQYLSIAIIFLTVIGCSSEVDKMELSGTVKGLKKGTLILQKIEDSTLISIDSVVVNGDSNFSFSEKIESPEIYYLYVRLKDGTLIDDRIPFFAENGEMRIETNLKKFGSAAKVSGSKNDSLLREYDKLMQRYINKNLDLIEQRLKLKGDERDSLAMAIEEKRRNLRSGKYFATINFALNKNEFEVAPYVMLSEAYNAHVKYLDTVYNALSPQIKNSKYGKELESFIIKRKKLDTLL